MKNKIYLWTEIIIFLLIAMASKTYAGSCAIGAFEANQHNLGEMALTKINVYLQVGNDNHSIINAKCVSDLGNETLEPIAWEPYLETVHTTTMGEARFQHELVETSIVPGMNYTYYFHCYCPDNLTNTENVNACYDEQAGQRIGFTSCSETFTVSIGTLKGSDKNSGLAWIVILLPMIFGALILYSIMNMGEAHIIIKLVFFLIPFLCFFASAWMSEITLAHYGFFPELSSAMGTTMLWVGIFFFALIFYLIIYIFIWLVEIIAQKKKARLEY